MSAPAPIRRLLRRRAIPELLGRDRVADFVRRRDVVLVIFVRERVVGGGGGARVCGYFDVGLAHGVVGPGVGEFAVGADVEEEEGEGREPVGVGVSWVGFEGGVGRGVRGAGWSELWGCEVVIVVICREVVVGARTFR